MGIDPGATVALAFVDLHGRVLDVASGKSLSLEEVVFEIQQRGDLAVLATDKKPLPGFLEKVAAKIRCRVFVPEKSLSVSEKNELVRGFEVRNNHEADALAAALKAYNYLAPKLRQIEKQEGENFEKNVKARLLGARPTSQAEVIVREKTIEVEKPILSYEKKVRELEQLLLRKNSDAATLQSVVRSLQKRAADLEHQKSNAALESRALRAEKEKERLEQKISGLCTAFSRGELELLDPAKLKAPVTEDAALFEKLKSRGDACFLVRVFCEQDGLLFCTVLDRAERSKRVDVDRIVEEHRKSRR